MPNRPSLNELLHAASRTFALGIDLLHEPLRTEIETAYLVLRVSDYLEDNESMAPQIKVPLLERWAASLTSQEPDAALLEQLSHVDDGTPDALVARNAGRVHAALRALDASARDIIAQHTADSTRGMARWTLAGDDFPSEEQLDDYMHEVAGRVGWLLTDLFALRIPGVARRHETMKQLGREFGLALQTVNVIRGLHGDWKRGWIFIPNTFVPSDAPAAKELLDGSVDDPGSEQRIVDQLVDKAERHLDAARSYLIGLPRSAHRVRLFCMLPWFFAVRTLAISKANPQVFHAETKITRADVRRIARNARLFGRSNLWLSWYGERLARVSGG